MTNIITPISTDLFQQQNFRMVFARLPGVELNCQRISIPGLECGPAMQNTPIRPMAWEGDQMRDDGPLAVQFKLDENFEAYLEIFNWMKGIRPLDDVIENAIPYADRRSDVEIQLLTSALKKNLAIDVVAAFPVKLDGFTLDATIQDIEPIVITVEFEFDQHMFRLANS